MLLQMEACRKKCKRHQSFRGSASRRTHLSLQPPLAKAKGRMLKGTHLPSQSGNQGRSRKRGFHAGAIDSQLYHGHSCLLLELEWKWNMGISEAVAMGFCTSGSLNEKKIGKWWKMRST